MRKTFYLFTFVLVIFTGTLYLFLKEETNEPSDFFSQEILLANQYSNKGLYDSVIYFCKKDLSKESIPYNACHVYNLMGYSYKKLKKYDSSSYYYIKSIKHFKDIDKKYRDRGLFLKGSSLNQIGLILKKKHLYSESIPYFKEAIKIFEKRGSSFICAAYYNLAFAQSQINDINCIDSYYKALDYATKYHNPKYEMTCRNNIGYLMLETNNPYAAIDYFNSALKSEYAKEHPKLKSFCFQGLAESHYRLNEYSTAKVWATKSLDLKLDKNIEHYLFSPYYLLAKIYRDTNEDELAEGYFKKAAIYFDHTKKKRGSISVFKDLSDIQLKLGKMKQSSINNERHFRELQKFLEEKRKATILVKSDSNLLSTNLRSSF